MKRGVAAILLALTVFAGGWHGTLAAGQVPANGQVSFGLGIDHHSLGIVHRVQTVRRGSHFWMSAHFSQLPGVTVRLSIAKMLGGGTSQFVGAIKVNMPDPRDMLYANNLHAVFAPGKYDFEFTRGSSVLAEGQLRITA